MTDNVKPLQAGDKCVVITALGRKRSPNIGKIVTIKHRQFGNYGADHSQHGAIYRCEGEGICQLSDSGEYVITGWADFAGTWLKRIEDGDSDCASSATDKRKFVPAV